MQLTNFLLVGLAAIAAASPTISSNSEPGEPTTSTNEAAILTTKRAITIECSPNAAYTTKVDTSGISSYVYSLCNAMFPAHNLDPNGAMVWAGGKSYEKFQNFKDVVLGGKFTFKGVTTVNRLDCNKIMEWILDDCNVLKVQPVGTGGWTSLTWREMKGFGVYENDFMWTRFAVHPRS